MFNFSLTGLLLGIILVILNLTSNYFQPELLAFSQKFIIISGILFLLSYKAKLSPQLVISSLVAGAMSSILITWVPNGAVIEILAVYSVYAIACFHQGINSANSYELSKHYETLFKAVWNTAPLLFISTFFVGLFWIVLMLWAGLFNIIKINFFNDLFVSPNFIWFITPIPAAIGLYFAQQRQRAIFTLRNIMLNFCWYLLPVLCFIGVIYELSWLVSVVILKNQFDFNMNYNLNFIFLTLGIIFANAVYQDGKDVIRPRSYNYLFKGFNLLLLIVALKQIVLFFYSGYDFTHNQIPVVITISSFFLYGFAYAISSFFSKNAELELVKTSNIIIAILLITATFVNLLVY